MTRHFSIAGRRLTMKARVIEDADDVTYVVVCDPGDGTTRGGHLLEGRVLPTLDL
jgi:hypothetical protein